MNRDSSPRRRQSKADLRALLDSKETLIERLIWAIEKRDPEMCLLCETVPAVKKVSRCPKCHRHFCALMTKTKCSDHCGDCGLIQCSDCVAHCSNDRCGLSFCRECLTTPRCTECGDAYCRRCNLEEDCNVKDCPFCKGGKRPLCVDCMPNHIRDTHDRSIVDKKRREKDTKPV
jgi:hypothetical protein